MDINREITEAIGRFAEDINRTYYPIFRSPDRKRHQLTHFFHEIDRIYPYRQKVIDEYVNGSNMLIPQFEISREVMPDVFSYSGYDETDSLRSQSKKDDIVVGMLDESLERGPAIVVDVGTYDGRRTKSIINKLKNKNNIAHISGIDTNPIVMNAFDGLDIQHTVFNTDANRLLHLGHMYSIFATLPMRKIYMGLENVLMNTTRLSGCEHENFTGAVSSMLRHDDEVIFELANIYDPSKYVDGVEEVFRTYFRETGIEGIVGGFLKAEQGHPDTPKKMIIIDGVKEFVEFNGTKYHFSRPKLQFKSNFEDSSGKNYMETDAFSQPYIFIGVSDALPREESFMTAIMFYINHVILQKESDWQFMNGESIVKLRKDASHKVVSNNELKRTLSYTAMETKRRGLKPLFRNFTDVLMGTGQYPAYYNALLDQTDMVFLDGQIAEPVKYFMRKRIGVTSPKIQQNMNRYIPHLLSGRAGEVKYNPFEGIQFGSLFDIQMPR